jgi:hypothetical protein
MRDDFVVGFQLAITFRDRAISNALLAREGAHWSSEMLNGYLAGLEVSAGFCTCMCKLGCSRHGPGSPPDPNAN